NQPLNFQELQKGHTTSQELQPEHPSSTLAPARCPLPAEGSHFLGISTLGRKIILDLPEPSISTANPFLLHVTRHP
ncbi:hypothetical protein LINPERHAP1_LOCUS8016, partial [Linum perenne]